MQFIKAIYKIIIQQMHKCIMSRTAAVFFAMGNNMYTYKEGLEYNINNVYL